MSIEENASIQFRISNWILKKTKYVIQFSQFPKNPDNEKRITLNNNIWANTCCA
jgi:hypothetical protein